jgi:hypothetical protein
VNETFTYENEISTLKCIFMKNWQEMISMKIVAGSCEGLCSGKKLKLKRENCYRIGA